MPAACASVSARLTPRNASTRAPCRRRTMRCDPTPAMAPTTPPPARRSGSRAGLATSDPSPCVHADGLTATGSAPAPVSSEPVRFRLFELFVGELVAVDSLGGSPAELSDPRSRSRRRRGPAVAPPRRRVVDTGDDVDDRVGGQPGNRGGADVLDRQSREATAPRPGGRPSRAPVADRSGGVTTCVRPPAQRP